MQDMNYHSACNNYLITTLRWINKPVLFLIVCWIWKKGIVACRSRFRLFGGPINKNSVWAKYMGGPHGQKSVWAMAHTAHTVPAPMVRNHRNVGFYVMFATTDLLIELLFYCVRKSQRHVPICCQEATGMQPLNRKFVILTPSRG